jgi:hypothetical protein
MPKPISQTHLYNDLRELLTLIVGLTDNFPKSHRFVIGSEMQRLCVDMNRLFAGSYMENSARSVTLMNDLLADYETLQILTTLAIEREWVYGRNKAGHLVKLMSAVGKQSSALRNSFVAKYAKDESKTS